MVVGGGPKFDDPLRCQKKGKPCFKWSLVESRDEFGHGYCEFHGGRRGTTGVRINHLPRFYSRTLKGTLDTVIEGQLSMDPAEQVSLLEELALMRQYAMLGVALFDAAVEKEDLDVDKKLRAGATMAELLRQVAEMGTKAAGILSLTRDKLSIHSLRVIVNQVVRCVWEACGEEHQDIAERLERLIREKVKLPQEVEGSALTPDEDVQDMIDSVPKEE